MDNKNTLLLMALFTYGLTFWSDIDGAENIYPDPSFEATGVPGAARTGERCGYLKVGSQQHWVCIGGRIGVEAFATYRATAYVKAKVGTGSPYALYCYAWNSFDWRFWRAVKLHNYDQWRKVEVTFVSPHDYMIVHPLGFIDAANCEAWIDDIVVEKIKSPAETMESILAKTRHTKEDIELLSRYYVSKNQTQKARDLMEEAEPYTKADIACLLAKDTDDPNERRRYVVDMVRFGGPSYANGMTRFNEITADMTPAEKMEVCQTALAANPSSAAARAYSSVVEQYLDFGGEPFTCSELAARIETAEKALKEASVKLPPESAARKEIETMTKRVNAAKQELSKRRDSLGRCTVKIGRKTVSPESHAIVIPSQATPQEKHAAKDLQVNLELLTGKEIPLVKDADVGDRTPIIVGKSALLEKLGVQIDFDSLGLEGIVIKTVGPALVLTGNKRGVLYACYTFLEDYLNCRWFTPDCTELPKKGAFSILKIDRIYVPPLEYRATDYPNSRDANWAVRNKLNGTQTRLDEKRGGKISYRGFVHTFNSLVPPGKYFAKHPEYYSEINGKRVGPQRTQLCLTNPDVLRIATETVRRWIEESPRATIFSVSQNDWWNYCQCPKCSALAKKEGSEAGPIIHFVNAIADAIKEEHPGKIIDTLAYQYSRKPTKRVRPQPNVAVRLCSIECCFAHPLESDDFNKSFRQDIEGWSKMCSRLHIWDYVINYAHSIMPFPNLYVLKPNINFFIRNGVTGIYEEANYFSKGGELAELRTWIMAKTLWNPSYDTDKAVDEFLAGYYEEAAKPIRNYINLVHKQVSDKPDLHVRIYSPPSVGYLTTDVIRRSVELFDEAEHRVKGKPKVLHRVQIARLPLMYSQIALTKTAYREKGDRLVLSSETDPAPLIARFEKIAKAEGVSRVREGRSGGLNEWLSTLPKEGGALRIVRLRNPALEISILPERGGRIWRIHYLPTEKDIMKRFGTEESLRPTEGGYEEYSESGYRSPGWIEPYTVGHQTKRSVTLETSLKNGLKITRRIDLHPKKAEIRIVSTISNPSKTTRSACLRVHPAFEVATTQKATAWLRKSDGKWRKRSLAWKKDPLAERELWLRGDDCPAGEWAVVDNTDDIGIVNRFDPNQIDLCYLNWSGKERRVNLELWSLEVKLQGGKSLTVEQSYEIVSEASKALAKQ